eukprot:scaffold99737_cov33-Tisochrysis_lutea.AAC.1
MQAKALRGRTAHNVACTLHLAPASISCWLRIRQLHRVARATRAIEHIRGMWMRMCAIKRFAHAGASSRTYCTYCIVVLGVNESIRRI